MSHHQPERQRLNVAVPADWPEGVPYNPKDAIDTLAARKATRSIDIAFNGSTVASAVTGCYSEPLGLKTTNKLFPCRCWVFEDTATRIGFYGRFRVPDDYNATLAQVRVMWAKAGTGTGDIELDFDYRAIAAGESVDPITAQESVNVNDAGSATAWLMQETTITLTHGNLAAGDFVEYGCFRDGTDAGDTLAETVVILGWWFEYNIV